jgi:hypothetical protein
MNEVNQSLEWRLSQRWPTKGSVAWKRQIATNSRHSDAVLGTSAHAET